MAIGADSRSSVVRAALTIKVQPFDALYYGKPQPAVPSGEASSKPSFEVTSVVGQTGGTQVPAEPDWSVHPHQQSASIFLKGGAQVAVGVTARNVEPGKSVRVRFNLVGGTTIFTEANSSALVGTFAESTATATLSLNASARSLGIEAWIVDVAVPTP